jgi:hypothetical protein
VLVEVWGAGDRREALEQRLSAGLLATFESSPGGHTARARAAIESGHRWLAGQATPGSAQVLGAGLSLLVVAGAEALLAQVGPALAFAPGPEGPVRVPATSPWLRRGVTALASDPVWPPLGVGPLPMVHWSRWPARPGDRWLLTATVAAETLAREAVAALFATPAERTAAQVDALLPEDVAVLQAALPGGHPARSTHPGAAAAAGPAPDAATGAPPAPRSAAGLGAALGAALGGAGAVGRRWAGAGRRTNPPPGTEAGSVPGTASGTGSGAGSGIGSGAGSATPPGTAAAAAAGARAAGTRAGTGPPGPPGRPALWRLWVGRGARAMSRVLVGLLPARAAGGPLGYQTERARLAAAAAFGLPLLVLAFALLHALRSGGLAVSAEQPAGPSAAPLAGPTLAATDDPAARITRLAGAEPVAALPGTPADPRRVVVSGGVPWVLNLALDQVDRVPTDGSMTTTLLRRGQTVGQTVVGALEDLVLVPGGAGERVLALDAAGNLWQLAADGPQAVARAPRPEWQSVTMAGGYAGNLYAVDRAAGQIWRYVAAPDGAYSTAGLPWLADSVPMAEVVDVAIDGAIYLLERSGAVRKFTDGSALPFRLAAVPEGFERGETLFADPALGLLATDPIRGRLLVFGQDGSFLEQLLFPPLAGATEETARAGRLADLHDAWWDVAARQLLVAAGSWLYRAPYTGPG